MKKKIQKQSKNINQNQKKYSSKNIKTEIQTQTTKWHSQEIQVLRLLPGDDIMKSLIKFVKENQIKAGYILTCVGSTSDTCLRPPGKNECIKKQGKFEITSLVGTLCSNLNHLHMSISDENLQTFGGHLLEGTIVRTTAEIIIGSIQNVYFTRPIDLRTGYDELSITEFS